MEKQTIKKSIAIHAPKETVWEILLNDKFTRIWYAEFSEGSHADTDWKLGSKAVFTDNKGCGIVGKIIANKPGEIISIEYDGVINDGIEDYESETAKQVKGGIETYHLSEKKGITELSIECDMGAEYFEMMSQAWDKAVLKIKSLAEKNAVQHTVS